MKVDLEKIDIPDKLLVYNYGPCNVNLPHADTNKKNFNYIKILPTWTKTNKKDTVSVYEIDNYEFEIQLVSEYIATPNSRYSSNSYTNIIVDNKYIKEDFAPVVLYSAIRCGMEAGGKINDTFKFANLRGRFGFSVLPAKAIRDKVVLDILE
jgi:hypothetical protein